MTAVAENDHGSPSGAEAVRGNAPAKLSRYSHRREVVRRDLVTLDTLGHIPTGQIHVPAVAGRQHVECFALLAPVAEVGGRCADMFLVVLRHRFPDCYGAVRILERKRAKQRGLDAAKHDGIAADTQGQCNHRNSGNTWVFG